jgi:hypothetical protein
MPRFAAQSLRGRSGAARAEKVWRETASGAKTDRAQLRRVLDQLDAGDVLMVTRLDRLPRSTRDLFRLTPARRIPIASVRGRLHRLPAIGSSATGYELPKGGAASRLVERCVFAYSIK